MFGGVWTTGRGAGQCAFVPLFHEWQASVLAAYRAANYLEALRLATDAHARLPRRHAKTWYWRACFLSLLGSPGDALFALQTGLVEGCWWDPEMLDTDPDLGAARALAGYAQIHAECCRRQALARERSRPECVVISPASAGWDPRSILFLHWWGDTARGSVEIWQPLVNRGWTLVAPQSSQPADSESFCWDDRDLALHEVRKHLEDCRTRWRLPAEGMVIAGASQGAAIAAQVAVEVGLPWLGVIPSFAEGCSPGRGAGALVLGETDPANARSLALAKTLESGGVPMLVRTVPGAGHDITAMVVEEAAKVLGALAGDAADSDDLSEGG